MKARPLPDAALDDRLAIVGRSGYGKTNAGKVLAEKLLAAKARVCIIDPTDAWWGLRLQPNGKDAGFPVAIFGGAHGDLALTETAGDTIGRAISESSQSTIVSMAEFIGENARRRFASAFLAALYNHNREPIHLIVDEADTLAPQRPVAPLDAEVLARMQQIVRRGRIRGFVPWLITQRPAVLNKDVLSQADALIAFNLTASQDRDAIGAWIEGQADKAEHKAILADLPKLEKGTAVVWVPGRGILDRQAFPLSTTFDSGRTPKRGEKRPTAELKPIDVEDLRANIVEVEETAKANDPATLKAEIARLRAELGKKPGPAADPGALNAAHERGSLEGRQHAERQHRPLLIAAENVVRRLGGVIDEATEMRRLACAAIEEIKISPAPSPGVVHQQAPFTPPPAAWAAKPPTEGINGPMQRILDALAWWEAVGVNRPSKVQVAVVANYSPGGGAFNNPLGRLRSMGFVEPASDGTISLMALGRDAANAPATPPTTEEMHHRALAILNGPQQRVLTPLLAAYPAAMTKDALAAEAGYSPDGGAFNNPLGSLRSLGFIDYPSRGHVVAQPILFVGRR